MPLLAPVMRVIVMGLLSPKCSARMRCCRRYEPCEPIGRALVSRGSGRTPAVRCPRPVGPDLDVARERRNALGSYLQARRALVTPQQAGIPAVGVRRVPGLRREEVAMLAGISVDYYLRLERGRDRNPSAQ